MEIEILKTKYQGYKNNYSLTDLYRHYIVKRESALMDSITGALALNAIFLSIYNTTNGRSLFFEFSRIRNIRFI